jgi:hypothetical protein
LSSTVRTPLSNSRQTEALKDNLCPSGIGDYGGRWSIHIARFIEAGFRVIAPDLPSVSARTQTSSSYPASA